MRRATRYPIVVLSLHHAVFSDGKPVGAAAVVHAVAGAEQKLG